MSIRQISRGSLELLSHYAYLEIDIYTVQYHYFLLYAENLHVRRK